MLAALASVILFSISGLAGERTARIWGAQRGNLLRLMLAAAIMWVVTLAAFRDSLRQETFGWLFFSGIIGFGLGDIALFMAYERIGARLTILLNLCSAPLWGAILEWSWLGSAPGKMQIAAGCCILLGVSIALLARPSAVGRGSRAAGILAGLAAGCGQGTGAVISRKAFSVAAEAGFALNGFSAATQRVAGGLFMVMVTAFFLAAMGRWHSRSIEPASLSRSLRWLVVATLCGPVLGVTFFQWSLVDLPSSITMAIVATTPVAMIPLVRLADRERAGTQSLAGSLLAVAGVVWLLMSPR